MIIKMMPSLTYCLNTLIKHTVVFFGIATVVTRSQHREHGVQQICQTENFEASCPQPDEIIFIEEAFYGRMELGRCVQTNYGNVGCKADVLRETDRRCSGKPLCRITVPDAQFDLKEPCPPDFKTYFQVGYKCLKITVPQQPASCPDDDYLSVTAPSGYLASSTTEDWGYGSLTCPWKILVPRGQRINITLIDFKTPEYDKGTAGNAMRPRGRDHDLQGSGRDIDCATPYAILTERWSSDRTVNVCGGSVRERHVFLSKTSSVDVRIIPSNAQQFGDENFFVLKYEAVGCADPNPPTNGWVDRGTDLEAVMGCNYSSGFTWTIVCEDNNWVGPIHNCSAAPPKNNQDRVKWGKFSLPYGVSVGVVIGLAIIVGVIILLVGLICLEWRKMRRVEKAELIAQSMKLNLTPDLLEQEDHYERGTFAYTQANNVNEKDPGDVGKESDYTYVREMWPLAPPAPCNVNGQNMFNDQREAKNGQTHGNKHASNTLPTNGILKSACKSIPEEQTHIYDSPRSLRKIGTIAKVKPYFDFDNVPTDKDNVRPKGETCIDDPKSYKPCLV